MAVIVKHRARDRSDHASGRVAHQPAHHLPPEHLVAHVLHRLQHLPAPVAAGGEDGGAAATVFLRDQQRQLVCPEAFISASTSAPGLGLPGFLKVHQVRQLLPALDIGVGIIFDARDQAVAAGRRQFGGGRIAMERVLVVRQAHRQQIRKRRLLVTAVGQRRPAAQEQQAAAAPIDELLDQILLRGGEIIRFDACRESCPGKPNRSSTLVGKASPSTRPGASSAPACKSCSAWCGPRVYSSIFLSSSTARRMNL